jgi:hypothetical protein
VIKPQKKLDNIGNVTLDNGLMNIEIMQPNQKEEQTGHNKTSRIIGILTMKTLNGIMILE